MDQLIAPRGHSRNAVRIPLRDRAGRVAAHATIDAEHADLAGLNWWRNPGNGKAARWRAGRMVFLDREVLGLEHGNPLRAVHLNDDLLDCRRSNLLALTVQQSNQRKHSHHNATSRYRGVTLDKRRGAWFARVTFERRCYWLGSFDTELSAATCAWIARKLLLPYRGRDPFPTARPLTEPPTQWIGGGPDDGE